MGEAKRRKAWVAAGGEDWGRRGASWSRGRGHLAYGWPRRGIDPFDLGSRCEEVFPPPAEPEQPLPSVVVRIDSGREPTRPSASTIRARKRAA